MTSDETVFYVLTESGLKGTKVGWPVGGAPPLPWFTYQRLKKGEFFADDRNYEKMRRYQIDLYQRDADDDLRDDFEEYVAQLGPYTCVESWIPAEDCWQTSYTITFHPYKD